MAGGPDQFGYDPSKKDEGFDWLYGGAPAQEPAASTASRPEDATDGGNLDAMLAGEAAAPRTKRRKLVGFAAVTALVAAAGVGAYVGANSLPGNDSPDARTAAAPSPSQEPEVVGLPTVKEKKPKTKNSSSPSPSESPSASSTPSPSPSPTKTANAVPAPSPSLSTQPKHHKKRPPKPITKDMKLQYVQDMSLKEKVGQKLMLGVWTQAELTDSAEVFNAKHIGGIVLMREVTRSSITAFVKDQDIPPAVATDQEGGTVQRFISEGQLPSALKVADSMSPEAAEAMYRKDYKTLAWAGITTNLGPVADVANHRYALGSRSYSMKADVVSEYVKANVKAAVANGIQPVVKHWLSGTVRENTDTHSGVETRPLERIIERGELKPYQAIAQYHPDVMLGNEIIPGLTDSVPASLSEDAVAAVRSMDGYQNALIYTDSLDAEAIHSYRKRGYPQDKAVAKAIAAGVDVALMVKPESGQSWSQEVDEIIGRISHKLSVDTYSEEALNDSVLRILKEKGVFTRGSGNFDRSVLKYPKHLPVESPAPTAENSSAAKVAATPTAKPSAPSAKK